MTVHDLAKRLRAAGCVPAVDGAELVFDRDVPDDLLPLVQLLATGLRAVVTGRRWFGVDASGRGVGPGEFGSLSPSLPLPRSVVLLCVESENAGWDRLPPSATTDPLTRCAFVPAAVPEKARSA